MFRYFHVKQQDSQQKPYSKIFPFSESQRNIVASNLWRQVYDVTL